MKVIDKQLMFISSQEREAGSASDFHISIPSHLLTCQSHQKLRVILNDIVLPYTWYNVQETNRHFQVVENGGTPFTVSLTTGSYNAMQLRAHLQDRLIYYSAHSGHGHSYTYAVSFAEVSAKFSFKITSPSGVNKFNFTSTSSITAYKLLGFAKGSDNVFDPFTGSLTSTGTISMILTDALLFHCDLLNNNVDKGAGAKTTFHTSNVFSKLPIDTSPFNNIIFQNVNDDYMITVPDRRITQMRFWFTTMEHTYITLNDDFSFTLKIEVVEDDEKTLISHNTGIGELLKLMLLQNHQHHQQHQQLKKSGD